ncbi:TylF/MycF/NovP-related O-methyltransferase [Mycobacterium spongiae]|uniref:Class I SAM-dependent methyltransferase n=1 Tax=Mycobacterium spongiae TaxID=886343 RepID=A0A975JZK6_9MYCO|nr:TylF/MycF/NovP-related O-methyltransferase [Mycobacterium spongiae]QUR68602.1 class I SAM-dependent methyltransferase [Mycobacterium spongiae]
MAPLSTQSPAFAWDQLVELPDLGDLDWHQGSQVLNFFPKDKDYRELPSARAMVAKYFGNAKPLNTDAAVLKYASDHVTLRGAFLEMGVCTGRTINFIAALNPEQRIWGFDSFNGLPEQWLRTDLAVPEGTFGIKVDGWMPPVLHNVSLVKGLFQETLPEFKNRVLNTTPIAFLHIDCDIYSSTKAIFDLLGDNIVPGTVIAFDELYNYPEAEDHEFKALQEFLRRTGKKADYLAFNQRFEQVVIQIT